MNETVYMALMDLEVDILDVPILRHVYMPGKTRVSDALTSLGGRIMWSWSIIQTVISIFSDNRAIQFITK